MNIGIIGGGNLGKALAEGLVTFGNYHPKDIAIYRRNLNLLEDLVTKGYKVASSNEELIQNSAIIFIAVLPQQTNLLLDTIKPLIRPDHLVVSLVTGVSIDAISARLGGHTRVVRAMPNTAISIGQSMTCIAANSKDNADLPLVSKLFDLVGKSVVIAETQMTSATALCACGIAFFLRSIRAAMQGGTEIDFHAEDALLMAAQTAKGAAMLLLENGTHPEEEIDRVTSPKGCTIAGLNHMEHSGFSSAFIKGITTSAEKAKDLYRD